MSSFLFKPKGKKVLVRLALALILITYVFTPVYAAYGTAPAKIKTAPNLQGAKLAPFFTQNAGQGPKEYLFYYQGKDNAVFFAKDKVVYQNIQNSQGTTHSQIFAAPKAGVEILGEKPAKTKINYFIGKNQHSNISTYREIVYKNLYPGIDLKFFFTQNNVLKYEYAAAPKANLKQILFSLKGVKNLKIDADTGDLVYETLATQTVIHKAPYSYQTAPNGKQTTVASSYKITNPATNTVGFEINGYDPELPLIIDPTLATLSASTFLGGSNFDQINRIVIDTSGNVYVSGYTMSTDFPTTEGAAQRYLHPSDVDDVFVSKLNSDLTQLSASTFLGGSSTESIVGLPPNALTVDNSGNVYVAGYTESSNFPVTGGAYDQSYDGEGDAFVAKLNSSLALSAATYLGKSSQDYAQAIALDSSGNVYVAGYTENSNFPTTDGAYDQSFNGNPTDAFISKLNSDLTSLSASTFLGGSATDGIKSMVIDASNNVYVTGDTGSSNFPATVGSYHAYGDVFVSELNSSLTSLTASALIGGSGSDASFAITLNGNNVYITGYTDSNDLSTAGAYDTSYNGGTLDAFVTNLDASSSPAFSGSTTTYLGSTGEEAAWAIDFDSNDNVYVAGNTDGSSTFPVVSGSYDINHNGDAADVFVSQFNSALTSLDASTFLGGSDLELGYALTLDSSDNVYVSGKTSGTDTGFPTTAGAYDETENSGTGYGFITKFAAAASGSVPEFNLFTMLLTLIAAGWFTYSQYKKQALQNIAATL